MLLKLLRHIGRVLGVWEVIHSLVGDRRIISTTSLQKLISSSTLFKKGFQEGIRAELAAPK
jgi:hypothetical protein